MAKEMMIVFVYDTCREADEAEDPARAVLYFHPGWVSDAQRHALCGQVVGAARCVGALLAAPDLLTLQSGKFILKHYGRYLLAIGSDRNIPDWVLRGRASLLASIIRVYHGDLAAVAALFPDERRLADKLYQMLETYLPVLQFGCHIFQRVPMLSLPKSAASTYLEAVQVLEHCRKLRGVLGGVILYNNKIVATQLPPALTSSLVVVEPQRVKSPAEAVATAAPLPLGARLLLVYVSRHTHRALAARASVPTHVNQLKKNQDADREKSKEFSSGMKRDKSLLFTAVPEEDQSLLSPPQYAADRRESAPAMPDVVPFTNRPRQRPNKLSLSFKTQASLEEECKENSTDKLFTGQTSVCSTPMIEYKRLHGNVLSICQNPDTLQPSETRESPAPPDIINESNVDKFARTDRDKLFLEMNTVGQHFVPKPASMRKLGSMDDIQEAIKRISSRAAAKLRPRRNADESLSPDSPKKQHTLTINDPSFPVFRNDGVDISESLYKDYLERYHAELSSDQTIQADNMFTFNMKLCEKENIEGFDSERIPSPHLTPKKIQNDTVKQTDQSRRKSLSLPLKSLSDSSEVAASRRRPSGVQLTPLMEKLSHLAFSDKSSGYSSRVTTPAELRDFTTPSVERASGTSTQNKAQAAKEESDWEREDEKLTEHFSQHSVKTALFISGLHDLALVVLLELEAANNPDVISALWDTSINALGGIEQQCMEPPPASSDSKDYSYLTLDPDWGTVQKGGPWSSLDIATMGLVHGEFADDPRLSELILRSDESVVLGATCGGAEVYYAESGPRRPGPPAPSDPLATVQLKAKRRLHRDHSIVIL